MSEINNKMFPGVVGQNKVLDRARFFIHEQNRSGYFAPLLITGGFGGGKNTIAKAISAQLKNNKGEIKPAIEINCSSISSLSQFFDDVVLPYLAGSEGITLILDEIHSINNVSKLLDALLTIWNTDNNVNNYMYGGQSYIFDLNKISFICMTTDCHLLPQALRSRMEILQLEELNLDDLSLIIKKQIKDIDIDYNVLKNIASYGRGNGRESFKLGRIINHFSVHNNIKSFTSNDWEKLKNQLSIRKDGINNIEYRIMKFLNNYGDSTLTKLASALNLNASATRLGFESYILANGYIEILSPRGRRLTLKGKEYLKEVKD